MDSLNPLSQVLQAIGKIHADILELKTSQEEMKQRLDLLPNSFSVKNGTPTSFLTDSDFTQKSPLDATQINEEISTYLTDEKYSRFNFESTLLKLR